MAQQLKNEWWFYIVTKIGTNTPELYTIQNPAVKLEPNQVVDVVRYIISDWKNKAIKGKC